MKSERAFYLGDVHVPHHDTESLAWAIDLIEKWKPQHLIFGGDLVDANAASRWPNEYKHTLADEYKWGNQILRDLRMAAPKNRRLVWIWGNHEDNIRAPNRVPKDLRKLVEIEKHVPEYQRWAGGARGSGEKRTLHVPYNRHHIKGAYRIGQVSFIHGHVTAEGRLVEQATEMANH